MKTKLLYIVICIAMMGAIFSCGKETDSETYTNSEFGFSFRYPAGYENEPVLTPQEVVRLVNQNEYKVPVYTATVRKNALFGELSEIPNGIMKGIESSFPGSSGFKLLGNERIELDGGEEAVHFGFEWTWPDGDTVMNSVFTSAFRGDMLITVSATTIEGLGHSTEELSEYCRSLRLSK